MDAYCSARSYRSNRAGRQIPDNLELTSTNQAHLALQNQHALLKRGVKDVSYHLPSVGVYDKGIAPLV